MVSLKLLKKKSISQFHLSKINLNRNHLRKIKCLSKKITKKYKKSRLVKIQTAVKKFNTKSNCNVIRVQQKKHFYEVATKPTKQ